MNLLFDLILGITLVGVCWRIIRTSGNFQAIVLFITFGLLLSLIWTRLKSPDIAIAEAAVGAGLTGVLLMDALGVFSQSQEKPAPKLKPGLFIPGLFLAGLFFCSVFFISQDIDRLGNLVQKHLPGSSLEHPITAVLLDFRSYDTWLEMGVLLAAVLGVLCVSQRQDLERTLLPAPAEPVGRWIIKILLPMMVLISGYLLWLGAFAPGGAFQAGVVLAAGGVLLWQGGHPSLASLSRTWWKVLLCAGFASFLVLAKASLFYSDHMLTHPDSKIWILALEYGAALSIAICLISLVLASPAGHQTAKQQSPEEDVKP
ncbi:hydrogenase subunit MbhD domain-containing protein [Desulfonatronovibrio hydrogenovorans]|uniref:hydrogenase subunit MbhD domain-containing protein n=1 Tax=Desulfonatronovibrio hydrogenovorans TaxID=53245 RepID=UPI0006903F92|nr:hydrogenase subunit MbhD domain-containing protein [Desulfonatronovibrio hydrogenovorans]